MPTIAPRRYPPRLRTTEAQWELMLQHHIPETLDLYPEFPKNRSWEDGPLKHPNFLPSEDQCRQMLDIIQRNGHTAMSLRRRIGDVLKRHLVDRQRKYRAEGMTICVP